MSPKGKLERFQCLKHPYPLLAHDFQHCLMFLIIVIMLSKYDFCD